MLDREKLSTAGPAALRAGLGRLMGRIITEGTLTVHLPDGSSVTGGTGSPHLAARITDWRAVRMLVANPNLNFGECIMDGTIEPVGADMYTVLDMLLANLWRDPHTRLSLAQDLRRRRQQMNLRLRSRDNVKAHYDLGNDLYRLFLDDDMQYSCAYFRRPDMTLDEAQEAKKHHIASKLLLDRPDLEVLDIGCGWGGMALTLAEDYGARVHGVTLSTEQLAVAQQRAKDAGLEDRVRFTLTDYRDVHDTYDRVVSVGMFEHVGVGFHQAYFRHVEEVLRPDGVALIHSIVRSDVPAATNPWINKYIFPGSYIPAMSEVHRAIEPTALMPTDTEFLRIHYAETLKLWRERFLAHRDEAVALYDERFARMWEFYLVSSELSFRYGSHMVAQVQLAQSHDAVPLTRDHMVDTERAHTA